MFGAFSFGESCFGQIESGITEVVSDTLKRAMRRSVRTLHMTDTSAPFTSNVKTLTFVAGSSKTVRFSN